MGDLIIQVQITPWLQTIKSNWKQGSNWKHHRCSTMALRRTQLRHSNRAASSPTATTATSTTRASTRAISGSRTSSRLFTPAAASTTSTWQGSNLRRLHLGSLSSNTAATPADNAPLSIAVVPRKATAARPIGRAQGRTPSSWSSDKENRRKPPAQSAPPNVRQTTAQWEKRRKASVAAFVVKKKPATTKKKLKIAPARRAVCAYSQADAANAVDEYRRGQDPKDSTPPISFAGIKAKYGIGGSVMSKILNGTRALDRVCSRGGPMPMLTSKQERSMLLTVDGANSTGAKCVSRETMTAAIRNSKIERGSSGDETKVYKDPSRSYFRSLQKKHPDLKVSLRVPQQKEIEKHKMSCPEVVANMFKEIKTLVENHNWPTAGLGVSAAPSNARASNEPVAVWCVCVCVCVNVFCVLCCMISLFNTSTAGL